MMMGITSIQAEATKNGTSIEQLGPARWPSTLDPYHQHSGHVLLHELSALNVEMDLLNTLNPPITNSVGISLVG